MSPYPKNPTNADEALQTLAAFARTAPGDVPERVKLALAMADTAARQEPVVEPYRAALDELHRSACAACERTPHTHEGDPLLTVDCVQQSLRFLMGDREHAIVKNANLLSVIANIHHDLCGEVGRAPHEHVDPPGAKAGIEYERCIGFGLMLLARKQAPAPARVKLEDVPVGRRLRGLGPIGLRWFGTMTRKGPRPDKGCPRREWAVTEAWVGGAEGGWVEIEKPR